MPSDFTPITNHLILLAHGSPAPETAEEFKQFAEKWAQLKPHFRVHGAFLSIGSPTLAEALETAKGQGAQTIEIVPLLLFSGRHLLVDIPRIADTFMAQNPKVRITIGSALALRPGFAEYLASAHE